MGHTVFEGPSSSSRRVDFAHSGYICIPPNFARWGRSTPSKLQGLTLKYKGVKIADGKGRCREEFTVVDIKVSPAPAAGGHGYYYAGCCRLDKGGNVPSGAVSRCPEKSCQA